MAIGVFDSGIGGLSVLKEIRKILPNEKMYFFGDRKRMPYGEKTKDQIIEYSKQIVEFLLKKKVDVIVIACNTATALALEELNQMFNIPIIGVINAGVKVAIDATKDNNIGIIGTKATITSNKYEIEIKKINNNIKVYSKACPLLVLATEEGVISGQLVTEIIKLYLDEIKDNIDTLILGCTHYPLLVSSIRKLYPQINIVDPAKETARELKNLLEEKNLIKKDAEIGKEVEYYATGEANKFRETGSIFLGEIIDNIEIVEL